MGVFASSEMFDVTIKYVEVKTKSGRDAIKVIRDEETELKYKGSVKELHSQWKMPNWKQSNDILRQATKFDPAAGERSLEWPVYRALLMENFMKSWDATDEKNETVPCTKDNLDKLDPNIAAALVEAFLSKTTVSDKELGE